MKKVLIIGGTGFVGRNLYEYFSDKYDLYAPTSTELNVLNDDVVLKYLKEQKFDVILNALDRKIDKYQQNSDSVYLNERLRAFLNLTHCCDYYGKMLYFGTGAEYARELPINSIKEQEFDRKIPSDTYGFLMNTLSKITLKCDNVYNFRLFGIFGKYEDYTARFISNSICKALYDFPITIRQNAVFDYLYIDDLCKMVHYFIENNMKFNIYNATSGHKYELFKLAEMINEVLQKELPILVGKAGFNKEYTASNERIRNEVRITIGDIKDQIRVMVEYYKEHISSIDKLKLLY